MLRLQKLRRCVFGSVVSVVDRLHVNWLIGNGISSFTFDSDAHNIIPRHAFVRCRWFGNMLSHPCRIDTFDTTNFAHAFCLLPHFQFDPSRALCEPQRAMEESTVSFVRIKLKRHYCDAMVGREVNGVNETWVNEVLISNWMFQSTRHKIQSNESFCSIGRSHFVPYRRHIICGHWNYSRESNTLKLRHISIAWNVSFSLHFSIISPARSLRSVHVHLFGDNHSDNCRMRLLSQDRIDPKWMNHELRSYCLSLVLRCSFNYY